MKKQNVRRDVSFDVVRDLRMVNVVVDVSRSTAKRQGIAPGWYSPRQLREVTK